jgi:O-antigen ligase
MGVLALVDILILDRTRSGGGHNEVAFGFVALTITSITIASYYRFSETVFGRIVFYLAILMGVCAMILSGTRTSWLVGFALLIIAMFFYLERYSFFKRVIFTLTLMFGIAIVSSSLPIVQKRVDHMIAIVKPYLKDEEQTKFNSLRYRVEAWKAAWNMGLADKFFGVGPGNWKKSLRAYVEQRPHLKTLERINHAHNQFMHTFFMSGFVGLFSLIALFTCHFWIFAKYLRKQYSLEVRCFSLAGLLLLVSYLLGSILGVPFFGKQYLMMYGFASATIWGSLLGALRESENTGLHRSNVSVESIRTGTQ